MIENIATKVYLDTGLDISVISEAFRMSIPSLRTKAMHHSELLPRTVTGDYLDVLGTLPIYIRQVVSNLSTLFTLAETFNNL